jgi:serine/threonine-protein kinase
MAPEEELRPGDILAGKYCVERVLGSGGMGVVVAARHLQLDERVALKFLRTKGLQSKGDVDRFLREARAAVKIKGEHVARVFDVGTLENGAPYIVMEYLEGVDLACWLAKSGPVPATQAVDFVLQACEAIAEAHALGIVHRDLKPANLFRIERADGQPSIKVLDFGISKVIAPGAQAQDLTQTADFMGSPLYMSPEQMRVTKAVDARTDIWSLGVILFELLTDHPPFSAEKVTDLAIKIATEPALPLDAFCSDVPAGLGEVIARCLEKDRERRFPSLGELAVALAGFGSNRAQASVERVLGTLRKAGRGGEEPPKAEQRLVAAMASTLAIDASSEASRPPTTTETLQGLDRTTPPADIPRADAASGQGSASASRRAATIGKALAAVAGGVGLLLVLARFGLPIVKQNRETLDAHAQVADTPLSSVTASQPVAAPAPAATPIASSSIVATPTPPATPSKSDALPRATTTPTDHAATRRPAPRAEPPAKPVPTTPCDPPYTIDSRGHRVPKPECL